MNIRQITFEDLTFRFADGGYVMSHVTQTRLEVRVLRLEADDGSVGWGEIVRKVRVHDNAIAKEAPLLDSLRGCPLANLPVRIGQWRAEGEELRGLAFGLDTAWLDWQARKAGVPLFALLGGRINQAVPEYFSLSGDLTADETRARIKAEAADWAVVQIKLGIGGFDDDLALIRAALESISAEQILLADFNGALDVATALAIIAEFDDDRTIWEEPCPTVDENHGVAASCGKPVMFDQCLTDLGEIVRVISAGLAHSIVIKPAFLGGLQPARVARDLCTQAGMPFRIDGPWCGHIATAANLNLSCGAPAELLICGCDLRQPLIIDDDWGGTRHLPRHRIAPFDLPGHGINPDSRPRAGAC